MPIRKKTKTIYVLGNSEYAPDDLPVKLIPKLKKRLPEISFIHYDPTEDINFDKQKVTLIDTVVGLKKITVFKDMEKFIRSPRVSVHDYDLLVEFILLKKLKKLKQIRIIGVPENIKVNRAVKEIVKILHNQLTFRK